MEKLGFQQHLQAYEHWKANIVRTVEEYRPWLEEHDMASPESVARIEDTLRALKDDRLTIAFVAEFSRGKTELINAIFFSDYGRRLLPSTAGRTTMCPTEMFWDSVRDEAYVRLLPIETRLQETSLNDFKADPKQWVHYPLDLDSIEQMEGTLREVVKTKRVDVDEAIHLGLYSTEMYAHGEATPTYVDIPKWRHALISFPHPLLKKDLVILDTPGLNALGAEPELTINMLPAAQAVLFVLAADTGVTRSDLEMWQHHIKGFQASRQKGLIVVLNKVDTLWDELQDNQSINLAIANQRTSTAKILGVGEDAIFPVSAQKGLLAKIKGDNALLDRSALLSLETYLSEDVLEAKQQIVLDTVGAEVGQMIENTRSVVSTKLANVKRQLDELSELSGKSEDVISHLMAKTREEQAQYLRNINSFHVSRKELKAQAEILRDTLDLNKLDRLIAMTRKEMTSSWTTHGLKTNMKELFKDIRQNMQAVVTQSEQTRKMIRAIYRKFQNEHGFAVVQPRMFSVMKYRVEMELLHQEAEVFRRSPVTAMLEQNYVVKRFFVVLISRAREIFFHAHRDVDTWLSSALEPLMLQIKDHKEMMEKRLGNLQKISRSKSTLQSRIDDLQDQYKDLARQLTTLRNMHNTIHNSRPMLEEKRPRPRLVSQSPFK